MNEMIWSSPDLAAELFATVRFMERLVITFKCAPDDDSMRMQWTVVVYITLIKLNVSQNKNENYESEIKIGRYERELAEKEAR